ncbi:hypothetical protein AGMMS50293_30380 [Spirochaetia bacterium]|nr:hypothetical protein AGMMS50293_30380 [Spirochaetia bacterium]
MIYILDACAVIAFLKKETESNKVKKLFDQAIDGGIQTLARKRTASHILD